MCATLDPPGALDISPARCTTRGGNDLKSLPIGTRFACGDAVLELIQVGKQCHAHCAIR